MPNWNQLLNELKSSDSAQDQVRRKYLGKLSKVTGRNVIAYYSGWLQNGNSPGIEINDEDKNGFMTVIHEMDRDLGLDILLHTPGGNIAATESLVDYIRSMFGNDLRAIIPQLAMSGGTMIACACREIVMGKHSSLGPIDPQLEGIPAHGVVEEFERAKKEIKKNNAAIPVWQPIIAKYPPAFIGECEKAITWSNEMTTDWLKDGMFSCEASPEQKIKSIVEELGNHAVTKSHARHLSASRCQKMGLKVIELENDSTLQDAVLSVHHACMLTFSQTQALKVIENQNGTAFIKIGPQVIVSGPHGPKQEANPPKENAQIY